MRQTGTAKFIGKSYTQKYFEERSTSGEEVYMAIAVGGQNFGDCGVEREKYNKCNSGADSGHKFSVRAISSCNLSVVVALQVRFTSSGMCVKSNTQIYVARTSNNRVISSGELYCCLLLQCEALYTCQSSFSIGTEEICFFVF